MDAMTRSFPMVPGEQSQADVCPVCLEPFHGRKVAPVDVNPLCQTNCGHRFHLDCISQQFVGKSVGSRQCSVCQQDPMPVVNLNTGKFHLDKFFPDQTFYNACLQGDVDQVDKSLAEGVNVNAVMNNGLTALMLASYNGNKKLLERLLNAGAEVNTARAKDGVTPLIIAAQKHHDPACMKLLIKAGAKVNAACSRGATALHWATQNFNVSNIKLLIEAGADANARTKDGITPLHFAAKQFNDYSIETLIEGGANVDATLPDGSTPLLLAALHNNGKCVEVLIKAEADVNAQAVNGATPVYLAAEKGNNYCLALLLMAKAHDNVALSDGSTPLSIATRMGNTECAKLLTYSRARKRK
ncbi:ankyrin repeat domain-containing protein [Endozoicomonas sp. ISHI1]|uniref:ankyrin repeat domain-containing protein n=1 Tax=Endozoicomonas sp. ISHI1 TaxID=2825882 RepID=UPI002148E13A|nr:ankyrin repeat domain-containing protein [Endozoicomonas sp. ISHI1]